MLGHSLARTSTRSTLLRHHVKFAPKFANRVINEAACTSRTLFAASCSTSRIQVVKTPTLSHNAMAIPIPFTVKPLSEPAQAPNYDMSLSGNFASIVPISPSHAEDIWEALQAANTDTSSLFTYLFEDPFDSLDAVRAVIAKKVADPNTRTYAILKHDISGHHKAVGMASLMRMDLPHKVIEVGSILYTPSLQRTPAATEAMYLLATYVFETLGMRRYEWKCHSKNAPSRRAAARYGFTYEGIFRQHMILKGQSRDTAWFAMIDEDWPALKAGFERWLAPDNFDANWRQFKTLEQCREV